MVSALGFFCSFCSLGPPSSAGAGGDLAAAHRPPGGSSHWARAEERAGRSCAGQLHMGADASRRAGRQCVVVWCGVVAGGRW